MLTYKQDTIRTEAIAYSKKANDWLDCDVVHDAQKALEAFDLGSNVQDVYDGIHYLTAAISFRDAKRGQEALKIAQAFGDTMTMLEHVQGRNGDAIERMEAKAKQGEVIRII